MRNRYPVADRLLALVDHVDQGRPLSVRFVVDRFDVDRTCAGEYIAFVRERRELTERWEGRAKVWQKPASAQITLEQAAALDFAVQALGELEGSGHLEALDTLAQQARLALGEVEQLPQGLDGEVQALGELEGSGHLEALDTLAQQARLALGEVEQLQLDRVTRNFQVRTSERTRNPDRGKWIRKLLEALHGRRVCHIEYQGLNGFVGRHEIEPWGLLLHRGRLLCMAGKRSHKRPNAARRLYLVDGIQKVSVTRSRFPEPASRHTDFAEIFRDSLGIFCDLPEAPEDIVLRVRGPAAIDLRQRAVHPSQQSTPLDDGGLEVRLRVVVCPELVSWVLGLLPEVEVLQPASLVERVDRAVARR